MGVLHHALPQRPYFCKTGIDKLQVTLMPMSWLKTYFGNTMRALLIFLVGVAKNLPLA